MREVIPKLRKSARGQTCRLNVAGVCSYDNETTVLCHVDSELKGMALKSPDWFSVFGCSECHRWLDQKIGSEEDRLFYVNRALLRTWQHWFDAGLLEVK